MGILIDKPADDDGDEDGEVVPAIPTWKPQRATAVAKKAKKRKKETAMKPSMGRTVIVKGISSNGSDEHPAIVTAVSPGEGYADGRDAAINVTVFPDQGGPLPRSSVPFLETRAKAEAWKAEKRVPCVAFWPDRVE